MGFDSGGRETIGYYEGDVVGASVGEQGLVTFGTQAASEVWSPQILGPSSSSAVDAQGGSWRERCGERIEIYGAVDRIACFGVCQLKLELIGRRK